MFGTLAIGASLGSFDGSMGEQGEAIAAASARGELSERQSDGPAMRPTTRAEGLASLEPAFSVIVPVHNEAGNIGALIAEIVEAMGPLGRFEILCVDDGSDDDTAEVLQRASAAVPQLRVLQHDKRSGQSTALSSGIRRARAAWIVTMDGDGQDDPGEVATLVRRRDGASAETPVMVVSLRRKRRDSLAKRLASRVANAVRRRVLDDGVADCGAGLKLFPRQLFLDFPTFDHMHRFLPALALSRGAKVLECPVNHRPRTSGRSHYGIIGRGLVGIVDLVGVVWLRRRTKRPAVREKTGERGR